MAVLQSAFLVCVSLANFIFVSWSTVEFMIFISLRQIYRESGSPGATAAEVNSETDAREHADWGSALTDRNVLLTLLFNLALLFIFILQHSLMAMETVKNWTLAAFGVLQRSLYVFCTAASLRLLMGYWKPIQNAPFLWDVCREPWATWFPLICFIVHTIAWLIIFSIVLIFDYAELMGLKQVRKFKHKGIKLQMVVDSAQYNTDTSLPSIRKTYRRSCVAKGTSILKDLHHLGHPTFSQFPSGRRCTTLQVPRHQDEEQLPLEPT
ncbi:nurim isoform X2 [Mobula hypostoma]|uniref:nurim isoform X2 n=1 Tax=Mobula hypostoma TaxID=723540 RepID=UPI002FC2DB6B